MSKHFKNKKFLITGGQGFLGQALIRQLKELHCKKIFIVSHKKYNLVSEIDVKKVYKKFKPDIVFHLAAAVGGIGINARNPGRFFYENAMMNLSVIHQAYINKVEKIISTGSVSSYPSKSPLPFNEKNIWNGYPEEINSSYGIAKRIIHTHSLSYSKQYKFNSILLLLTNLYGPNDNFRNNSSHVIAALVKKFYEGKIKKKKFVEVWGDGKATRDFCYVDDAANGLILAAKKYKKVEPLNLGSGKEISIKKLASLVKDKIGYVGKIKWLKNKPVGPKRRFLSITKARREIGFKANTSIDEGLSKTINWYVKNNHNLK
ncbi:GDP-fucose synthetase [bacterium TMED277]|nr:MAG: GDP-fucose synthetase [bacterium TMED277]|tara:strand:- start:8366 stop:9316 length:951 start_codon:yes stop_codon:yes gene_type:complete